MSYNLISRAGFGLGLVWLCASAAPAAQIPATGDAPPQPVIAGPVAPSPVTRFVAAAWTASPEKQAAEAAIRAAEARLESASRPIYNPEVSLEGERGEVDTKTVGLSQTIDMGGKRRLAQGAAHLELSAAEADFAAARQVFAAGLLETLARYQSASELHKLAVRRTHLMERFADAAEQRLAAGDIGPLDAALAKVAYTDARMAQAGAERALSQAAAELRAVTGTPYETWPELPQQLPGVSPDFRLEAMIDHLPAIQALAARAEAQALNAKQVDRERIPDPTFDLTGGREGEASLIGLSVSIPLPVRNTLRADARAAAQEAVVARQEVLQERRAATARIEGALAAYRVVREAWGIWLESGQGSLSEQVTLLQRMWEAGDLSASDYLVQARQNVDTQAAATELAGEVWSAAFELLHVTGSLDAWLMTLPPSAPAAN